MKIRLPGIMPLLIAVLCVGVAAAAIPVSHLQVRILTGGAELAPGSVLELRIYEIGRAARRLPLVHGEGWPRNSTRLIPLDLTEPLDPRAVTRFALYYRAANPQARAWEVASADVELTAAHEPTQRLLNATLSGVIPWQGELATEEREAGTMACVIDADCDDHRQCDGRERCAPGSPGADARGCVQGEPVVCPVNQVCGEEHGCRGLEVTAPQSTK